MPLRSAEQDLLQHAFDSALRRRRRPARACRRRLHGSTARASARARHGQSRGVDGRGVSRALGRAGARPGRHALRPRPAAGRGGRARIDVVEAAHPSPDSASLAAGARLLELATERSRRRDAVLPDFGRRLVAGRCAAGADLLSSRSARPRTFDSPGRGHSRDQLRAQASVAAQRRPARRRRASGTGVRRS